MKQRETSLVLLRRDYCIIIFLAIATYIAFIIGNPAFYLLLGLGMLVFYLKSIAKTPAAVLSISLLAGHPFSYTLAKTGIPLLSPSVILGLNLYALLMFYLKNKHLKLPQYRGRMGIFLILFFLILVAKWAQGGFDPLGFEMLFYFGGFAFIAGITALLIVYDNTDIQAFLKITIVIFSAYVLALFGIMLTKSNSIEVFYELENPIGMSFFLFTNAILLFYVASHSSRKWYFFIIILSVWMTLLLGQRSFFVGILMLMIIYIFQTPISRWKKIIFLSIGLLLSIYMYNYMISGVNYKLNYLYNFLSNPIFFLESIEGYSMEQAYGELGTIGSRFYMWYMAVLDANPWFGNGLGDFWHLSSETEKYPHNIFIEFYYLLGLPGLIGSIFYFGGTLYQGVKKIGYHSELNFISANMIVIFCVLLFSSSIFGLFCYYIIYAILQRVQSVGQER